MTTYAGINNERRRAFSESQARATKRDRAVERYLSARRVGFPEYEALMYVYLPRERRV